MPKKIFTPRAPSGFTLGRAAFDRISAVEGLRRPPASEAMFEEFDRRGLDAAARRLSIRDRHGAVPDAGEGTRDVVRDLPPRRAARG